MSQLSLESINKVEKMKNVLFSYSIDTAHKYYGAKSEEFVCDVNCSNEELVKKCEVEMRRRLNGLFDGDDCHWSVKVISKKKV